MGAGRKLPAKSAAGRFRLAQLARFDVPVSISALRSPSQNPNMPFEFALPQNSLVGKWLRIQSFNARIELINRDTLCAYFS